MSSTSKYRMGEEGAGLFIKKLNYSKRDAQQGEPAELNNFHINSVTRFF